MKKINSKELKESEDAKVSKKSEGFVEVEGGKIWYRIYGQGNHTPVIVIHGGPGSTHFYLMPIKGLSRQRPVIFYDQLGCGNSDRPDNPNFWVVDRFVDELDKLIDALNLKKVHLLGQSWGATIAGEYVLAHSGKVASVIFADPYLSSPLWIKDAVRLKKTLPKKAQTIITAHEKTGTTDSKEYQDAYALYRKKYLNRLKIIPAFVKKARKSANKTIYEAMWGPAEFHVTGSLKNYDLSPRLPKINVPTLFVCGKYDEATPESTTKLQKMIPNSKLHIFKKSAHNPHTEETKEYLKVIGNFLNQL